MNQNPEHKHQYETVHTLSVSNLRGRPPGRFHSLLKMFQHMNVPLTTIRRTETGSAPATMLTLVCVTVILGTGIVGAAHGLLTLHRMQNLTDKAALAAADAASGRVAGYPCQLAEDTITSSGIALSGCSVEGLVSWVTLSATIYGFQVETRAKAGPKNLFHS